MDFIFRGVISIQRCAQQKLLIVISFELSMCSATRYLVLYEAIDYQVDKHLVYVS